MNKALILLLWIILGVLGTNIFTKSGQSSEYLDNSKLIYWSSGLPKNCRAIIKENMDDYKAKEYPVDDIIESINRNCGEFWYSWTK